MKRNVDLTIDGKFNRNRMNLRSIVGMFKHDISWRNIKDRSFAKHTKILVGNKMQRKNKRFRNEYDDFQYCECCGLNFSKRPYLRGDWELCKNCELNLESKEIRKGYWNREFKKEKVKSISLMQLNELIEGMPEVVVESI